MKMILKVFINDRETKQAMISDFLEDDATNLNHTERIVKFPDRTIVYCDFRQFPPLKDILCGYEFDEIIIDEKAEVDITVEIRNYLKMRMK